MLENGYHDVPTGKVAMVVTYLQMFAPPAPRPAALPDGVQFRSVTADVVWFKDVFARVGAPWLWFGRLTYSDDALATVLMDPMVEHYTLRVDGQDEALLELDFRQDSECELSYFGLTEKLIGTGAGRFLMSEAIKAVWAKPIKRFFVHTCTIDSQQALSFYQRSGFTPYMQKIEIDDDPRLTGHLSEDMAPHVPIIR
ncbi:MAG: GNAT family N-acetyltransferase [Pseudomonadota bacterium]